MSVAFSTADFPRNKPVELASEEDEALFNEELGSENFARNPAGPRARGRRHCRLKAHLA